MLGGVGLLYWTRGRDARVVGHESRTRSRRRERPLLPAGRRAPRPDRHAHGRAGRRDRRDRARSWTWPSAATCGSTSSPGRPTTRPTGCSCRCPVPRSTRCCPTSGRSTTPSSTAATRCCCRSSRARSATARQGPRRALPRRGHAGLVRPPPRHRPHPLDDPRRGAHRGRRPRHRRAGLVHHVRPARPGPDHRGCRSGRRRPVHAGQDRQGRGSPRPHPGLPGVPVPAATRATFPRTSGWSCSPATCPTP